MKKIIVTGATSFIGANLINALINENYFIYAVTRPNSSQIAKLRGHKSLKIVELEMKEYSKLDQIINDNCDFFCSLAWDGTRGGSRNNLQQQRDNYIHSKDALEAAFRLNCKKVITAGSQAEYGVYKGKISEKTICNPNTEYGKWKLQFYEDAYKSCRAREISFIEPRFFSVYGPGDYENSLIMSTIKKMMNGIACDLTECTWKWNYLYIDDAVEGLLSLIKHNCADGAYNLASNDTRPLKEFVLEMKSVLNSSSELKFGSLPIAASSVVNLEPDVERIFSETGWVEKLSFTEGIRKISKELCVAVLEDAIKV